MTVIKQANLRVTRELMAALDDWGTRRYGSLFSQLGLATKAKMALEHTLATDNLATATENDRELENGERVERVYEMSDDILCKAYGCC